MSYIQFRAGVTSQSISGLSQSFNSSDIEITVKSYADDLLGEYLKSDVSFIQINGKWGWFFENWDKNKKKFIPKIEHKIKSLNGKGIQVGAIGSGEHAWLAGIHEYGCKIEVTPKMRAWLHYNGLHLKSKYRIYYYSWTCIFAEWLWHKQR